MNTDLSEAQSLAGELTSRLVGVSEVEIVICPPFTNLQTVGDIVRSTPLVLGAQDVFWEAKGAFTGEISARMLISMGAEYVITGHSERRHILDESSEIVNRKSRAALQHGLKVILAIGETEYQRTQGQTEEVLEDQLERSLAGFVSTDLDNIVLAYEPVWAIGTGLTATPEQAQQAHEFVRTWVRGRFGDACAQRLRIQCGGSVNAANARQLLGMPDIDGALVGGASLIPDDFAAIIQAQQDIFNAG